MQVAELRSYLDLSLLQASKVVKAPSNALDVSNTIWILDRYVEAVERVVDHIAGNSMAVSFAKQQKAQARALGLLHHGLVQDFPLPTLLQTSFLVGLRLFQLLPQEGETVDDFLSRLLNYYNGLSQPQYVFPDENTWVSVPQTDSNCTLYRSGQFCFKGVSPSSFHDFYAETILNELAMQGGVGSDDPVLPVLGLVPSKGNFQIVTPWIDQNTYEAKMGKFSALTDKDLEELKKLSSALAFIHNRKIAHLDIKPSNIFCVNDTPKVFDFGLSVYVGRRSHARLFCGSSDYMWGVELDNLSRRDINGMAVTMYELIFGKAYGGYIRKNNMDSLPDPLREVLSQAFSKTSYPDVAAFNEAFTKAVDLVLSQRANP